MMTKTEVLNAIITVTRETGQGVPGFLRMKGLDSILDELILEKKIVSTIHHYKTLPNDEWLVPVDCYNVWLDTEPAALTFVRMYLKIDVGSQITETFYSSPELAERYIAWLEINKDLLEKMVNLKEVS